MIEIHGGNIYKNHADIDFSVNINPLGVPHDVQAAIYASVKLCGRYPDITSADLKESVCEMLNISDKYLLFGNGASELFMGCVHGIQPKRTVIPVPSFYGYEYAAKAVDGETVYYEIKDITKPDIEDMCRALTDETDLLFLANPNNPTGVIIHRGEMIKLLSHCRNNGIYVVLDECFIEFCRGENSMLSEIENFDNLILVRAFTKIFAIPGVRLGYMVCSNHALLECVKAQLPEWNISVIAQAAGCACARQKKYVDKTALYVEKERKYLSERLKQIGITVISGGANFLLIHSEKDLYGSLLEKGILIRDCGNFRGLKKGFYRIAVRNRAENKILLKQLEECT